MKKLTNQKLHALDLTDIELEKVADLASQNLLLKEIALELSIDYRSFIKQWRNRESPVYLAHRKGVEHMELSKNEILQEQIFQGNVTAIQIHQNNEAVRHLNDLKTEIFGI